MWGCWTHGRDVLMIEGYQGKGGAGLGLILAASKSLISFTVCVRQTGLFEASRLGRLGHKPTIFLLMRIDVQPFSSPNLSYHY